MTRALSCRKSIASIHHHELGRPEDPVLLQVNTRVAIMNMTRGDDGHIHALSESDLLDSQAEAKSVYYATLAERLQQRGIEVTLNPETSAPEVKRVTQRYIEAVSPILTYGEADRIRHPIQVLVTQKEVEERRAADAYIATIERIEGKEFLMRLDSGQEIRVDTETFNHFDKLRGQITESRSLEIGEGQLVPTRAFTESVPTSGSGRNPSELGIPASGNKRKAPLPDPPESNALLIGEQDSQLRQELNHRDESRRKSAQRAFKAAASSDGRVSVRREPSGRSSCRR
jgi:hypothetical protein